MLKDVSPQRVEPRFVSNPVLPSAAAKERWVVLAVGAIAAVVLFPYRHFAGDDAYISFRFARNLATGHGFAFNPDQPTNGSTSPLWVALMAAAHRLGLSVPDGAHLLNALCVLLLVAAFVRLTRIYIASLGLRALAALLLVVDPWFVHWSMSGMENALALLLLCGAVLGQQRQRGGSRVGLLAPVCCGLGMLTRPEFAVLSVLLVCDTLLFEGAARFKKAFAFAVVAGLIVLPWLVYAKAHFGSVVPNTVSAKLSPDRVMSLESTLKYFASFFPFEAAGLVLVLVWRGERVRAAAARGDVRARWFLPVAWMLALPVFYVTGGAPVSGRYLMLGLPAYLLVGVKGLEILLEGAELRGSRPRLAVGSIVALTFALLVAVQARYVWYITAWPRGMDPSMLELAQWFSANAAPGDVVAGDQIGVLGFYSNRTVLDTEGLVSPEMQAPHRRGDLGIWQAVRDRRPEWIVSPHEKSYLMSLFPEYSSLELTGTYTVQREGASSVGLRVPYKIYRTGWTRTP